MSEEYSWTEGDTSILEVVCENKQDLSLIDLTGKTVTLRYKIGSLALVERAMTPDIDQVVNKGLAAYQFLSTELTPGILVGEIRVNDATTHVLTSVTPVGGRIRKKLL